MLFRNEEFNSFAQFLMDVITSLADNSQKPSGFSRIPGYLAQILNLPSVSLAVIGTSRDGTAILLSAFSGTSAPPSFEQDLLLIHERTRPSSPREIPAPHATLEMAQGETSDPGAPASFLRATVFSQVIDPQHRMMLVVHQRHEDAQLSGQQLELLQMLARQLGRMLESLVIWMARPEVVGAPFEQLTEREWVVLRCLSSDAGEKQLADQLGLSPHTLHSHIKSIYRKVGVQGRLQLLLRVEDALRDLRQSQLQARLSPVNEKGTDRSVSAA
jgi:DNA-binding CsgD family transcriptional regulator